MSKENTKCECGGEWILEKIDHDTKEVVFYFCSVCRSKRSMFPEKSHRVSQYFLLVQKTSGKVAIRHFHNKQDAKEYIRNYACDNFYKDVPICKSDEWARKYVLIEGWISIPKEVEEVVTHLEIP